MKLFDLFFKISIYVLLFILIATSEFRPQFVHLFLLGAGINFLPVVVGKFLKNRAFSENLFIAATYGGGNRGVFLVAMLFPQKLLDFMMIDLGNFFSLLFLYPMASQKRYLDRQNLLFIFFALAAICAGIYVNRTGLGLPYAREIKNFILYAIIIYSLFQIVMWIKDNKGGMLLHRDFALFLASRIAVIGTSFILYFLLSGNVETILLTFIVLPTSSLLFAIYSPKDKIYERVIKNTITSMVMYLVVMAAIGLFRAVLL